MLSSGVLEHLLPCLLTKLTIRTPSDSKLKRGSTHMYTCTCTHRTTKCIYFIVIFMTQLCDVGLQISALLNHRFANRAELRLHLFSLHVHWMVFFLYRCLGKFSLSMFIFHVLTRFMHAMKRFELLT